MKGLKARIIALLPSLARDLMTTAGIASISYGAWRFNEPLGFVVGGGLLLAAGLLASRADAIREREQREYLDRKSG